MKKKAWYSCITRQHKGVSIEKQLGNNQIGWGWFCLYTIMTTKKFVVPFEQWLWGDGWWLVESRGVNSNKELWEGNGNSHFNNSDRVTRMGREPGTFVWKKLTPVFFFPRIASESEKRKNVCEDLRRIFHVFRSPKNKRFLDGQFKLLWPWPSSLYFDI